MFSSNTSQVSGGYEIQRSLRFNSADSAFLNRTPASAGNRTAFTFSVWIKRTVTDSSPTDIFSTTSGEFFFNTDNTLNWFDNAGYILTTTQVFRDPSSWYHLVFVWNTASATASNRAQIYVNGVLVTAFTAANYPAQNATSTFNNNVAHNIGRYAGGSQPINAYMTEVNFIDGQALTPSSFGAFDAQTGVWGPTRYAGSYGTNGFYLNFSDNSNTTAATLGRDYSGNSNNWTPNNFSVAAGAGNDSLVDVPTNFGVDTGVGGSVRGNYCTLNPLDRGPTYVLANGNLDASTSHSTDTVVKTTIAVNSGKWYAEVVYTTIAVAYPTVGIVASDFSSTFSRFVGLTATSYGYGAAGVKLNNGSTSSYGATWTTGDVIGIAFDLDAGTITFYKNGVSQGVAYSGIPLTNSYCVAFSTPGSVNAFVTNFGQRPFAYTAPSGFKALNTQNLPTPTIGATTATQASQYFNTVLNTGTGANENITVGFQPDWVWTKSRSAADNHLVVDVLRGIGNILIPNQTAAESAYGAFVSFNSNGFTKAALENVSGRTYVNWNWKANGAGVTNTAGSITSTVSANTTSGFSVVTYTGTGSGATTIGHGLGVAPSMIIVKDRSQARTWNVYQVTMGNSNGLKLNLTDAIFGSTGWWNSTSPTASVFTVGIFANEAANYVAYCFAEVPGYSRFGSYTGNGSADGPFCFCGFRPAYVMYKKSGGPDGDWVVLDVKRDPTNVTARYLAPNASQAESNDPPFIDILSNGFKMRRASGGSNENGVQYIFAAFAESPFKYSLAR